MLAQPFQIQDQEVFISARIGIAVFPTDGETPQELLRSATAAMPGVDSAGHGGWRFFTHELDANARRRLAVESNLRHAPKYR